MEAQTVGQYVNQEYMDRYNRSQELTELQKKQRFLTPKSEYLAHIAVRDTCRDYIFPEEEKAAAFAYMAEIGLALCSSFEVEPVANGLQALVNWIYSDSDMRRGILLKGDTGRGKTMIFEIANLYAKNFKLPIKVKGYGTNVNFDIVNARQIAGEYSLEGYQTVIKYASKPILVIDDLGSESAAQSSYGNKVNAVVEVLMSRASQGLPTFATTNIVNLREHYGNDDRLISRMSQMFDIVALNHKKDFRLCR